jgi:hypothetical protein
MSNNQKPGAASLRRYSAELVVRSRELRADISTMLEQRRQPAEPKDRSSD